MDSGSTGIEKFVSESVSHEVLCSCQCEAFSCAMFSHIGYPRLIVIN